jgi:hypothetical protein
MPFLIGRFLAVAAGVCWAPAKGGNATAARAEAFRNCRRVVRSFSIAMKTKETRFVREVNEKQAHSLSH